MRLCMPDNELTLEIIRCLIIQDVNEFMIPIVIKT